MSPVRESRLSGELTNSIVIRNRLTSSIVRGVPTIGIVPRLLAVSAIELSIREAIQRLENSVTDPTL